MIVVRLDSGFQWFVYACAMHAVTLGLCACMSNALWSRWVFVYLCAMHCVLIWFLYIRVQCNPGSLQTVVNVFAPCNTIFVSLNGALLRH